eukprot:4514950-Amphidinium_carterae.1
MFRYLLWAAMLLQIESFPCPLLRLQKEKTGKCGDSCPRSKHARECFGSRRLGGHVPKLSTALVGNHFQQPAAFPPWIHELERGSLFCVSTKTSVVLSWNFSLSASALGLCYLWSSFRRQNETPTVIGAKTAAAGTDPQTPKFQKGLKKV